MTNRGVRIMLFVAILLSIANVFMVALINENGRQKSIFTGNSVAGFVGLVIIGNTNESVTLDSPQNTTYNFNPGDLYVTDLNVSANFDPDFWEYSLWDLRHNVPVEKSVSFTPNTTFNAVRWGNLLTVSATKGDQMINRSVVFSVFVPNSAPVINHIDDKIYACESSFLSYFFNATDVDENTLIPDISPKNPFYVFELQNIAPNLTSFEIFSGILTKKKAGIYNENVSVSDGEYLDQKNPIIEVIEINHAPVIQNIGVQTLWTRGDNSTFYKQVAVSDMEDGNQNSGNLSFNASFSGPTLFNISSTGVINFSADESLLGVHNVSICVTDLGINASANISLCGQTGGNLSSCTNFSITATNVNRPPTITNHYPLDSEVNVSGNTYFNISTYDPDGTVPDVYWYWDNVLREYDSGKSASAFTYSPSCGTNEVHTLDVLATDGELNDSFEWNLNVSTSSCPAAQGSSGIGGGAGGALCSAQWACNDWSVCQNSKKSLELGTLAGEDYRNISDFCTENGVNESSCGFQIRSCYDTRACNLSLNRPEEVKQCYYTSVPSCFDGIKNCHDGGCELLIDCGGPCNSCPTCSDGIQNQGEWGVDCGGPCPNKCQAETPLKESSINLIVISVLLIIVIFMILKLVGIHKAVRKRGRK